MNRDQVHKVMTGLAIGGSLVGGVIITQNQVAEHTLSFSPLPTSSANPSSTATATNTASSGPVTKQGDMFTEQIFGGQIQLSVTETAGKVTNISLDTATATGGRQGAFSYLVQEAVAANGSNIANISGATYTTKTFKKALDSAMSKF
jgi:uncharacterized protein with FMN-binding domain